MADRAVTTLFMLTSLDGKISSGSTDLNDADQDFCRIDGVKEGLAQYYRIEQTTDLFSLNTGRTMVKIGVNDPATPQRHTVRSFVIVDSRPHLTRQGVKYLSQWAKQLIIVTTNKDHPAFKMSEEADNISVLYYEKLDFGQMFRDLKNKYGADRVTVQSGGSLNGAFLRRGVIDYVHIVVAPLIVGGADVPTLADGEGIKSPDELFKLTPLTLLECNKLENSYIELKYKVNR